MRTEGAAHNGAVSAQFEPMVDLTVARATAESCAKLWGIELEPPFALSNVSFVAPAGNGAVIKVSWEGDDESLHEGEALEVWGGDGAVKLLRRKGRALLEERALPGTDLSRVDEEDAVITAVALAERLWRPASVPFRSIFPEIPRWFDEAEVQGSELVAMARGLFAEMSEGNEWLVHGDFHHHNILLSARGYVAIDPKPYLCDREYDVPSFLWNPIGNVMADREKTERRISAFVAAGLDEFKIRAWTVIRGSYLRTGPEFVAPLRELLQ